MMFELLLFVNHYKLARRSMKVAVSGMWSLVATATAGR